MRNIVITAGAAGLGRTLTERFLDGGDRVFVSDISEEALSALPSHKNVHPRVLDIGDRKDTERWMREVLDAVPAADVLVNNVGIAGPRGALEELSPDALDLTMEVNLGGAFQCMRHLLPGMKAKREGCIVNVSTVSVRTLPCHRIPYIVSKSALEALTLAAARELGPFNVRCNAVRPGMMDNDRLNRVLEAVARQSGRPLAEVEAEQLAFVSMKSKVSMGEVADLIIYFASESARHVTGQVMAVDGGMEWEM